MEKSNKSKGIYYVPLDVLSKICQNEFKIKVLDAKNKKVIKLYDVFGTN